VSHRGSALLGRFERTGSREDLDRAIGMEEEAVESTPGNHPSRAMYLMSLGLSLQHRFDTIGSIEDLNRAIENEEQGINSMLISHPERGMYLNNLGTALQHRFDRKRIDGGP
jgi:hypothetical protein